MLAALVHLDTGRESHLVVMASVGTGGWTLGPLLDPGHESHLVVMASVGTGGWTPGPLSPHSPYEVWMGAG